jgi:hypothetical protein
VRDSQRTQRLHQADYFVLIGERTEWQCRPALEDARAAGEWHFGLTVDPTFSP